MTSTEAVGDLCSFPQRHPSRSSRQQL